MPGPTNADIMMKLGELGEGMRGLRRDMDAATESRKGLYTAVEAQNREISTIRFTAETSVQMAGQVREEVKALHISLSPLSDLKDELPKMVEGWKDLKRTSSRLIWLISITGIPVVGIIIAFGGTLIEWIRAVLRIPG